MLPEVLSALMPKAGGRYTDGTIGGAGHAEAILAASAPTGWLYGCDRDGAAVEAARRRLAPYAGRFELRQMNFAELAGWVPQASCDGMLLDLGVSSPQLDVAERGFSFQQDAPLDMRMDRTQQQTAADLVNTAPAADSQPVLAVLCRGLHALLGPNLHKGKGGRREPPPLGRSLYNTNLRVSQGMSGSEPRGVQPHGEVAINIPDSGTGRGAQPRPTWLGNCERVAVERGIKLG